MLFFPGDPFGSYQKGKDAAIKNNWDDLFNQEKLRQDFQKTDLLEQTTPGQISATNAGNAYRTGHFNMAGEIENAAYPGVLARTKADSAYGIALASAVTPRLGKMAEDTASTLENKTAFGAGDAWFKLNQQPTIQATEAIKNRGALDNQSNVNKANEADALAHIDKLKEAHAAAREVKQRRF
jgi:hypothetical protein